MRTNFLNTVDQNHTYETSLSKEDPLVSLASDTGSNSRAKIKNIKNSNKVKQTHQIIDYLSPQPLHIIHENVFSNSGGRVLLV